MSLESAPQGKMSTSPAIPWSRKRSDNSYPKDGNTDCLNEALVLLQKHQLYSFIAELGSEHFSDLKTLGRNCLAKGLSRWAFFKTVDDYAWIVSELLVHLGLEVNEISGRFFELSRLPQKRTKYDIRPFAKLVVERVTGRDRKLTKEFGFAVPEVTLISDNRRVLYMLATPRDVQDLCIDIVQCEVEGLKAYAEKEGALTKNPTRLAMIDEFKQGLGTNALIAQALDCHNRGNVTETVYWLAESLSLRPSFNKDNSVVLSFAYMADWNITLMASLGSALPRLIVYLKNEDTRYEFDTPKGREGRAVLASVFQDLLDAHALEVKQHSKHINSIIEWSSHSRVMEKTVKGAIIRNELPTEADWNRQWRSVKQANGEACRKLAHQLLRKQARRWNMKVPFDAMTSGDKTDFRHFRESSPLGQEISYVTEKTTGEPDGNSSSQSPKRKRSSCEDAIELVREKDCTKLQRGTLHREVTEAKARKAWFERHEARAKRNQSAAGKRGRREIRPVKIKRANIEPSTIAQPHESCSAQQVSCAKTVHAELPIALAKERASGGTVTTSTTSAPDGKVVDYKVAKVAHVEPGIISRLAELKEHAKREAAKRSLEQVASRRSGSSAASVSDEDSGSTTVSDTEPDTGDDESDSEENMPVIFEPKKDADGNSVHDPVFAALRERLANIRRCRVGIVKKSIRRHGPMK